jgi:cytoskeletal protein RodZ
MSQVLSQYPIVDRDLNRLPHHDHTMTTADAQGASTPSTPTRGKRKADEAAEEPGGTQNGTRESPWEITTPERPKATDSTSKQQQQQQQPKVKKAKQAGEYSVQLAAARSRANQCGRGQIELTLCLNFTTQLSQYKSEMASSS